LITGVAGFLGSNLCRKLLADGYRVYGVDNFATGKRENILSLASEQKFTFLELDVTSDAFLEKFMNVPVTQVFHLACPTGVPNIKILGEEMLMTCSKGTVNALEVAKKHGAKALLTSSAEVYGDPKESPQNETYTGNVSPIGPRSAYEEGKRFAESLFKMYADKYALEAKIVRVFNTYGPGMSLTDERVIPHFLKCILEGKPLRVYGDGKQTRTHLYVDDLLMGLLTVMEKGIRGEAYNVGGDKQVSIKELAELMLKITESPVGIDYQPHFIEDHMSRLPSTEKVRALGWTKTVSLEEGLGRMIPHYAASKIMVRDGTITETVTKTV
jgi:nucleoside-diphosphate-sugar epimerase